MPQGLLRGQEIPTDVIGSPKEHALAPEGEPTPGCLRSRERTRHLRSAGKRLRDIPSGQRQRCLLQRQLSLQFCLCLGIVLFMRLEQRCEVLDDPFRVRRLRRA